MGSADTKRLTLRDREWNCPACQVHHIRDHNAAQNILTKGQQWLQSGKYLAAIYG